MLHKVLLHTEIIFNQETFSFPLPCQTHAVCHTLESRLSYSVTGQFCEFQENIVRSNWKSGWS